MERTFDELQRMQFLSIYSSSAMFNTHTYPLCSMTLATTTRYDGLWHCCDGVAMNSHAILQQHFGMFVRAVVCCIVLLPLLHAFFPPVHFSQQLKTFIYLYNLSGCSLARMFPLFYVAYAHLNF